MANMFFDYELPERLIAQEPASRRDEARLLVVRRDSGTLEHRIVRDLPSLLSAGDLIVLNDTKVLPARLIGSRDTTGGQWEALFSARADARHLGNDGEDPRPPRQRRNISHE